MQIFKAFVILIVGVFPLVIAATANAAECKFKFCAGRAGTGPKSHVITNENRQRLGDFYDPGPTLPRIQIRDNERRIIGYIEKGSGRITNTSRQEIGNIESLLK